MTFYEGIKVGRDVERGVDLIAFGLPDAATRSSREFDVSSYRTDAAQQRLPQEVDRQE